MNKCFIVLLAALLTGCTINVPNKHLPTSVDRTSGHIKILWTEQIQLRADQQCYIDISKIEDVKTGDEYFILGQNNKFEIVAVPKKIEITHLNEKANNPW